MSGIRVRRRSSGLIVIAALAIIFGGCITDFGPPTVTFDGGSCSYDGLPEFTPGEAVTFTFDNRSDREAGFGVVKIQDGISTDQLEADGIEAYADDVVPAGEDTALSGESTSFEFRFRVEGDWLIYCIGDNAFPATIVEVSGPPEPE